MELKKLRSTPLLWLINIDDKAFLYFKSRNSLLLIVCMGTITRLGSGIVWIIIYGLSLCLLNEIYYPLIFKLIVAEIAGLIIIVISRYTIRRERPVNYEKSNYLSPWNRYSFPSHHSYRSFMIAGIVGIIYPAVLPYFLVVAAVIAFSRVYLLKHFLSDVLAGIFLGLFCPMFLQLLIF